MELPGISCRVHVQGDIGNTAADPLPPLGNRPEEGFFLSNKDLGVKDAVVGADEDRDTARNGVANATFSG